MKVVTANQDLADETRAVAEMLRNEATKRILWRLAMSYDTLARRAEGREGLEAAAKSEPDGRAAVTYSKHGIVV